ncbi:MAG: hypothetical protein J0H82_01655 [Alphaproteobacteria bacterium]|nr:hypothetical protein [Alphaproteobacteria bacterium]
MAGDDDYLVRKAVVDRPAVEKGHLMKHGFLSAFTRFAVALATLVFLAWGGTAYADDRNFTVVNNTGYPIKGLFVNPPGDNVFNDNELSAVLAEGASFPVKFSGADKGCTWNIKVTWTDNSSSIFRNLDLCSINNVFLKYDKASDTASYTTN